MQMTDEAHLRPLFGNT